MYILSTILADASMVAPASASAAPQTTGGELDLLSLTLKGGVIMIPLLLLSVIAVYVFIERYFAIRKAARQDDTFMLRIKDYIHEGDIDSAKSLCKKSNTPYARLIEKGISRLGRPMNDILVAIENTGNLEVAKLERGFPWLATTAAGAPMLGFLGTVTGMVRAFYNMAEAGSSANITVLSAGIYEALVTTVAGLVVGIIALFAYNYLVARVDGVVNNLEAKTMEFMDLLNEPAG